MNVANAIRRLYRKRRSEPAPVISTEGGNVPEWARRQAAINMRLDPAKRAAIVAVIKRELRCDDTQALLETMRRYPEAFAKPEAEASEASDAEASANE